MLRGNVTIMMLFMINAIFRGAGDAAIAMRVLWMANAINIVLGPCFIFGLGPFPELGIVGAAVATNIGRGTGALYAFSTSVRAGRTFEIGAIIFASSRRSWGGCCGCQAPARSRFLSAWPVGSVWCASFPASAAMRCRLHRRHPRHHVCAVAFVGMANAAATMVGQALGAGKPDRAERAVWIAGFYNMIFSAWWDLIFVFFAAADHRVVHTRSEGRALWR